MLQIYHFYRMVLVGNVTGALFNFREAAVNYAQQQINPNLPQNRVATSFGNLADAHFKDQVQQAINSGQLPNTLRVTERFQFGVDVFDTATGIGYDLTTATVSQVYGHDLRYIGQQIVFNGISYSINDVISIVY
jgi:hypothetical protein